MNKIVSITFKLFIIAVVTSLLLAFVNELTSPVIKAQNDEALQNAMSDILVADSYEIIQNYAPTDKAVGEVYAAKTADGVVGYCIKVMPLGFGGAIDMLVAVDTSGKVTGVKIITMSETPELGTKTADPSFLEQYSGKTGTIGVSKGTAKDNEIVAITGATVSSKAVTSGVNIALNEAKALKGENK